MESELLADFKSDFVYIRTPLLSYNALKDLYNDVSGQMADMDLLAYRLKTIFTDAQLQEAIYLASPVLFDELIKFLSANEIPIYKRNERLVISLFRYFSRMCARSTPFGLFAGSNLGGYHNGSTILTIESRRRILGHLRLDMDFVGELSNQFESKTDPKSITYFTNSSVYKVRDKIRYVEVTKLSVGRKYKISTVSTNALLDEIISKSKVGKTISELTKIALSYGISESDFDSYVNDIISAGILISHFEPNVTGNEFMFSLADNIRGNLQLQDVGNNYTSAISHFGLAGNQNVSHYRALKKRLETIISNVNESRLFQVDMQKNPIICSINESIKRQLMETVFAMAKLNAPKSETKIEKFKKLFEARYETKAIPLPLALDPDIGINYETIPTSSNTVENIDFFDSHSISLFKFNKFNEAVQSEAKEVIITEKDLRSFPLNKSVPDSFSVMARLNEQDSATDEPIIEYRYANGPSGAKTLGRFCHSDKNLFHKVSEYVRHEEKLHPDKIYAEIVHIPENRIGNVISRPIFRQYEIVFLAKIGTSVKHALYIDDLYLKIESGNLILFSKKLRKQVIPRLTCAHNYASNCLQLYHFLCDLQTQNVLPGISWNWNFLSNQQFLPRVKYKNVIVFPATWNIYPGTLDFLIGKDDATALVSFLKWVADRNLPQYVFFVEGDNELFLNLHHPSSMLILKKEVKKRQMLTLKEAFDLSGKNVVKDENGDPYRNEIVVPFYRTGASSIGKGNVVEKGGVKREFPIGSDWVYFKIYTGVATADALLKDSIFHFTRQWSESQIFDQWFFIRYYDPEFHIRIRFHSKKANNRNKIVSLFSKLIQPFIESGEINDFSMHTYKREIERYGMDTMLENEELFYVGSRLTLKLISVPFDAISGGLDIRLGGCLILVSKILDGLKMNLGNKILLCQSNRDSFAKEFTVESKKELREQIKTGYRMVNQEMKLLLSMDMGQWPANFQMAFKSLDTEVKDFIKALDSLHFKIVDKQKNMILSIASSQIHMFINRVIISNSRFTEFVVYEYLLRYYQSMAARSL